MKKIKRSVERTEKQTFECNGPSSWKIYYLKPINKYYNEHAIK